VKTFIVLCLISCAAAAQAQSTQSKTSTPPPAPGAAAPAGDLPLGQLRVIGSVHLGEVAPDFTTVSSSGRELTLSRLKGDWLVLVFAQDREDFAPLRGIEDALSGTGARVYGICKEKPQRLRSYAESEKIRFELLADDTGEISSLYGYYNWEQRSSTRGFVVLDRQGVVRLALQGQAPPQQLSDLTRYTIVGF